MWGAILGLVSAALGYIFNSKQAADAHNAQQRNIQQSLNAQKEENEKTREYNLMLAEKQNSWSIEQWDRENAYNDPSAQMERMRNAGLNPDMMYGGGVSGNLAASSPSMTSGAAANPMDWSALAGRKFFQANPADSVKELLQNRMMEAQIKNIEADTANKGSDTNLNNIEGQFRSQLLKGQIDESALRIKLGENQIESVNRMDAQQIKESESRIANMNQMALESMAKIKQINSQIVNDNIRVDIEKKLSKSQIEKMASECHLNYSQAKEINSLLSRVMQRYDDEHKISVENLGQLQIQSGVIQFEANTKTSSDWWLDDRNALQNILRYFDMITDALDGILTPVSSIIGRKSGGITINNNI